MMAPTNECTLPLPTGMDCVRCLVRFEAEVAQIRGVQRAAVDTRGADSLMTRLAGARAGDTATGQV